MADITTRAQRKVAKYLDPGETLEVAVLCEPKGTYGLGMLKLAAAPGLGNSSLNRAQAAQKEEQIGMVDDFPAEPCVVAVTQQRTMAFPSNGLKFSQPTLIVSRHQIRVGQIARRGLGRRVQLVFGDGSAIEVDVQPGQPIDRLVAALGTVAPIR